MIGVIRLALVLVLAVSAGRVSAQQTLQPVQSGWLTVPAPRIAMAEFVDGQLEEGLRVVYDDRRWQLFVDGREARFWALEDIPVLAGRHEITITGECFEPLAMSVDVPARETAIATVVLTERVQPLSLEIEPGTFGAVGAAVYTSVRVRDGSWNGFGETYRRIAMVRSGDVAQVEVPVCSGRLLVLGRDHIARPILEEQWRSGQLTVGKGDVRHRSSEGDCFEQLSSTCLALGDDLDVTQIECAIWPNQCFGFERAAIGDLNGDGVIDQRFVERVSGRSRPAALVLSRDGYVCGQFAGQLNQYNDRLSPHSTLGHRDIFKHVEGELVFVYQFDGARYVHTHDVACHPHYANEDRPYDPMAPACRYEGFDPMEVP